MPTTRSSSPKAAAWLLDRRVRWVATMAAAALVLTSVGFANPQVVSGEQAQAVARQRGWVVRLETADGGVVALQSIVNGVPRYYETHNRNSARTISTDDVWQGGSAGLSLDGAGINMAIWDGGRVLTGHNEFAGRASQRDISNFFSFHATHVAGTMIASGVLAESKGMAHAGQLDCYDFNNDTVEMRAASLAGLRLSNHSYGLITGWILGNFGSGFGWYWFGDTTVSAVEDHHFGFYSLEAVEWDDIAFRRPDYLMVKSAGNDRNDGPAPGTPHFVFNNGWVISTATRNPDGNNGYDSISHASTAKNVLIVGAVEDLPGGYAGPASVVMSSFSGWGPADDGRIRPDVVANGVQLLSASTESTSSYEELSGTSMSSPSVAGSIGLLLQHYLETHDNEYPLAATLKALVIHAADECGAAQGPDNSFGWGLMNTAKAADLIDRDVDDPETIQELTLNNGQGIELSRTASGANALRVTLYWNDPPGAGVPDALDPPTRALVNDLDLRVIGPSGMVHFPWRVSAVIPAAAAVRGDNTVDNIEVVDIEAPSEGEYTIRIGHKGALPNRGFGSLQHFSLIVSGFTPVNVVGACCSSRAPFPCLEGRTRNQCRLLGGVYGGDKSTCAGRDCDRCDSPICEFCWTGTAFEGNCPDHFIENGSCDCGCQFEDEDCNNVSIGACCDPVSPHGCIDELLRGACLGMGRAFAGRSVLCSQADCSRCDTPNCQRCWLDTIIAYDCEAAKDGDGVCDCGCQFADSDCGCGDGFCLYGEHACSCPADCESYCGDTCCSQDESGRGCPQDCFDLRGAGSFYGCYGGPGVPRRFSCQSEDLDEDGDVDSADYKLFILSRFRGP